jgi:hypothetical protein
MKWLIRVLLVLCLCILHAHAQNTPATYTLNTVYTPLANTASGDFNGDGKLDFAATCSATTQVTTYLGRGDGFPAQRPASLLSSSVCFGNLLPIAAGSGDFNHDGKTDAVFLYNGIDELGLSYLLGNGDGTFQDPQQLAFPTLTNPGNPFEAVVPINVYVADFNNDGYSDILVTDNDGDLIVYLANKNGGFSSPVISSPYPPLSSAVLVGDVNKDGYPDLVATTSGLTVALGNGDGTFTVKQSFNYPFSTSYPGQLADLNGDGNLDVLVFDNGSMSFLFFAGDGTGSFQAPVVALSPPAAAIDGGNTTETLLDIDQDGVLDLVFFGLNPTSTSPYLDTGLSWAKGNGNGTFEQPAFLVDMGGLGIVPLQTIDLENGGHPAILDTIGDLYLPAQSTAAIKLGGYELGSGYYFDLGVLAQGQTATASMPVLSGDKETLNISSIQTQLPFQEDDNCLGSLSGSCQVTVSFVPTSVPGTYSGNIAISSNASAAPIQVPVFASVISVIAGEFTVSPQSLNFGTQQVGTSKTLQATFTSVSGQPATVANVEHSGSDFTMSTSCRGQVTTCTMDVTFTPQTAGSQTGSISLIDANGIATTVTLTGTGSPAGPQATVTPLSLAFGSQTVGTASAAQPITLSNTGNAALQIQLIAASTGFTVTNNCGSSLASGANCTLMVAFAPATTGIQNGTLAISDNSSGSPQTVALSGTGTAAPMPQLVITPLSLAFGSQTVGTTSSQQPATLSNTGDAPLQIQSITASTGFAATNSCGTSLAPGASCTLLITFSPVAAGSQSGTLSISDNASGSPQTVALSGIGIAASAQVAQLTITPSSLSFSSFAGSSSNLQTVTVANTGGLPVQMQSVTATTGFSVSNACGSLLAPGSSCTIAVTFAASSIGIQTGTLTIQDDAPGSPQTVSLSGTDSDFSLSAASGSSTSATISSGQTATYQLAVTPAGGFSGTLTASCTGAPAGMQCVSNPATVSFTGSSPQNVTFTVSPATTSQNLSLRRFGMASAAAFALLFGVFPMSFRKTGRRLNLLAMLIISCALLATSACGGGPITVDQNQSGTTYVLTAVLTTSSGQQVQQPLVLTVTGKNQ